MNLLRPLALAAGLMAVAFTAQAQSVVVGGKNFTEQQLISEITAQYLTEKGYDVDRRAGMGSAVLREAQENGQVDVYWEYTGTSLLNYNKVEDRVPADQVYDTVKKLDAEKGLTWLQPSEANNTYALAMQRDEAEEMGIKTLSDLASAMNDGKDLTLASNAEWYARDDGLKPLQKTYGFEFPRSDVKRMDSGLTYQALKEDQVDVALVFATDGRIRAFDFVVLEDDKGFFPNYAMTPVVRTEVLEEMPELADHLNALSERLNDDVMSTLNARVDVEKETIEDVAADFLKQQNLI
ncbi:Substrate-binding region of ABC-type glycine betaine transporter [Caenispirillum salinarum AK4]|uniref:Substrate-binding region of ABC-type glycine betaine transporter n=1 Tax=Caenispirillum salinarum AK4 TaxID=1238182 RepID=K9HNG0_9PROT|nr:glycine betaine ABC transporter substrate-binding protein [Caenispirillum salinarum]EKV31868.1 Substrate-binding region of ABC-type glycine betaine transporter [Caenispirillum salinarum AK4]